MVGVPKTRRCGRCKHQRIKCDENWPTCSSCKRANAVCPGPPTDTHIFVHNTKDQSQDTAATQSSNSEATSAETTSTAGKQDVVTRIVRSRTTTHGSTFGTFRFAKVNATSPRPLPSSDSDRAAQNIVTELETSSQGVKDFLSGFGYWSLMPARVEHCPALQDCVNLFFAAWTSFQRGLPCSEVTNYRLYGKALRSLYKAFDGSQTIDTNSLAALTVVERYEHMFDLSRPEFWSVHRAAIATVMRVKGPPQSGDTLDVYLTLNNYSLLVAHWLVREGDDFYKVDWRRQLLDAVDKLPNPSGLQKNLTLMQSFLGDWTVMAQELRALRRASWGTSASLKARSLLRRAISVAWEIDSLGNPVIENGFDRGAVSVLPDPGTPIGEKYDFSNLGAARYVELFATQRIVLNRIIHSLHVMIDGSAPDHLDTEHWEFCKMIWMSLPYMRSLSLMAAILYSDSFYIAYEASAGDIKDYLLTWFKEIVDFRGKMPFDRDRLDAHLRESAVALTGRAEFRDGAASEGDKGDLS